MTAPPISEKTGKAIAIAVESISRRIDFRFCATRIRSGFQHIRHARENRSLCDMSIDEHYLPDNRRLIPFERPIGCCDSCHRLYLERIRE